MFYFLVEREQNPAEREQIGGIIEKIDELIPIIGIRKNRPVNHFYDAYRRDIRECIDAIAYDMGLPIKVKTAVYPRDEQGNNVACIDIPDRMPFYGTSELIGFPVKMTIKSGYVSYETFVTLVAHELSHIVLKLFRPQLSLDEVSVDLVPLLLGYEQIVEKGRIEIMGDGNKKIYGYLNNTLFSKAIRYIKDKYNKYKESI